MADNRSVVIDCSALVNLLVDGADHAFDELSLHAPTLIDYELVSAAARVDRARATRGTGSGLLLDAGRVSIVRHDADNLVASMWSMRHGISLYDGAYVALARMIRAPLVTSDRRLATAAERFCEVELVV